MPPAAKPGEGRPCNAAAPAPRCSTLPAPRSSPQHRVRASVQLSPPQPERRRPSEAAVSRCILGPAPQRGRRGKVPPHTIRPARERRHPCLCSSGSRTPPFSRAKSHPRPKSSPVVAPGSARPRLTGRYAAKVQKRRPPMSATTAATTFMTGSPRQAAARPLSFAGQVPNRIKLSAQSIFLKDHFFII